MLLTSDHYGATSDYWYLFVLTGWRPGQAGSPNGTTYRDQHNEQLRGHFHLYAEFDYFLLQNQLFIQSLSRFFGVDTSTPWREREYEPTNENAAKLNKIATFCRMLAKDFFFENFAFLYEKQSDNPFHDWMLMVIETIGSDLMNSWHVDKQHFINDQ